MGLVEIAGGILIVAACVQVTIMSWDSYTRRVYAKRKLATEIAAFEKWSAAKIGQAEIERDKTVFSWAGKRKFRVLEKVQENALGTVISLYLGPHDDQPIAPYEAGQFLTLVLKVPGKGAAVRCYSLSDSEPRNGAYRITVKRLDAPKAEPDAVPGVASTHLHFDLDVGELLDVLAPAGEFVLNSVSNRPVVLIAGGIGLTPIFSMINALVDADDQREIRVFYGVQNRAEQIMRDELQTLSEKHPNIRLMIAYSQPSETCVQGSDYHHRGHIDIELLRENLPANNYEYYLCGPPNMLGDLSSGLIDWGVPSKEIHCEAFGLASARQLAAPECDPGAEYQIHFRKSGATLLWSAETDSILEMAESAGVRLNSGCRTGNCGTCLVALKEGDVVYPHRPGRVPDVGSCLPCIGRPTSDLVLDA